MTTVIEELPLLLQGVAVTLQISILVIIAGSIIGIFGGLGLLYGPPGCVRCSAAMSTWCVRLPLLVTIFIIFYVPRPSMSKLVDSRRLWRLSSSPGAHFRDRPRRRRVGVTRPERRRESTRSHVLAPHLVCHPAPRPCQDHPALDEHGDRDGRGARCLSGQRERAAFKHKGRGTHRSGDAVVHRCCTPLLCNQLALSRAGLLARAPDSVPRMKCFRGSSIMTDTYLAGPCRVATRWTHGHPMVCIENVHKRFGNLEVLKGISLDVEPGEVVCIIGASGSGKTTLLRCINFLETYATRADLCRRRAVGYRERDFCRLIPARRRTSPVSAPKIGMVFQQFNLFPHMTALEQCHLRADQGACGEKASEAGANCWSGSACRKGDAYPASSPAASSSGWRSPAPWRWSRS